MKTEIAEPGVFGHETLYIIVRAWVLKKAPFAVLDINVPDVVNALIESQSGLSFNMSDDMPPKYSGQSYETFGHYAENIERHKDCPPHSAAWFTMHLTRLKTREDTERFSEHIRAMMTWMYLLGYLILEPDHGYLATQKLLDNVVFLKTR